MLLPLGILASASGGAADFELISTTLVTSAVASVTFSSLNTAAAAYKHLQLRITERSSAAINSQMGIRFNGDSGANYSEHQLKGNGSSVTSYGGGSVNFAPMGTTVESGATANAFGARIIDILDFSQTTKNKTIREFAGAAVSPNNVAIYSAAWFNTAAVTSLEVFMNSANIVANSRISLYGLKG
jgi:hypothetical protein